jgi:hypothetical protein
MDAIAEFSDTKKYPTMTEVLEVGQPYVDSPVYGINGLKFNLWLGVLMVFGCDLFLGCIPEIDLRKVTAYRRTVFNWIE